MNDDETGESGIGFPTHSSETRTVPHSYPFLSNNFFKKLTAYISPKDPEPIFGPTRNFRATRSSMVDQSTSTAFSMGIQSSLADSSSPPPVGRVLGFEGREWPEVEVVSRQTSWAANGY